MHPESLPRLKAPRDDGAVLAFPPLAEAGALAAANAQLLETDTLVLQGRPLRELRQLARREALAAAQDYLRDAGEPIPSFTGDALFLAGHQPELFHPGVWLKNFALHGLARGLGAAPLNLIVDNDTAKAAVLRVPHNGHIAEIPFDSRPSDAPYEERAVQDEALFASLPERVAPLTASWPLRPVLDEFWAEMQKQGKRTSLLGERFVAARRALERAFGLQPLEVPLSRICQTEAFAWFAVHLLRELPRFHAIYNAAIRAYRRRHGLRSSLHPAPDLAQDVEWLETPFWAWRAGEPRRQKLWALPQGDSIALRAGTITWPDLRGNALAQAAQWRQLAVNGSKIRTRALSTTLFARLLLGNLFIHGIGGGKYDEVTDDILRQFFGLEPPGFLVFTGTLLLPLERFPTAAADHAHLQCLLRDIHWNPQRHVNGVVPTTAAPLMREKQTWIEQNCTTHAERVARFHRLRRLNEQLQGFAHAADQRVRQESAEAEHRARLHQIHAARDYAYCLFPEERLRPRFFREWLRLPRVT